jgi:hypothetical protein
LIKVVKQNINVIYILELSRSDRLAELKECEVVG